MTAKEWAKSIKELIKEIEKKMNELENRIALKDYFDEYISADDYDELDDFQMLGIEMDYKMKIKAEKILNRLIDEDPH